MAANVKQEWAFMALGGSVCALSFSDESIIAV